MMKSPLAPRTNSEFSNQQRQEALRFWKPLAATKAVGRGLVLICSIAPIYGFSINTQAAEIVPFRTTAIDSSIELRYLSDEHTDSNNGAQTSSLRQIDYEEELSIKTQNYVYHPNLLKLDLGLDLTFKQNSYETGNFTSENDDNTYNFNARARFMDKKPYPVELIYRRDNPSIFTGLSQPLQQENTLYSLNLSLLEPLIPLKLEIVAAHYEEKGGSATTVYNDSIDSYGLRANKIYSPNYSHHLSFDHEDEFLGSGSRGLTITPTTRSTDLLVYSSDWNPGGRNEIRYHDAVIISSQEGIVNSEEARFDPMLSWQHSEQAKSQYSFNYLDRKQDGIETTNQLANVEFSYRLNERVLLDSEAIVIDSSTTSVDDKSIGVIGRVNYLRPVTNGTLQLSVGLDYRENEREAATAQASVIGETITLSATFTPVPLAREFIIPGSIVVQNLARTQTFIEGLDYRIITIGSRSEIQQLVGGNLDPLPSPPQVVVDYTYQTGGSAAYSSLAWFYDAKVSFNQFDLYLRHRVADQELSDGSPTLPLVSKDILEMGGASDYQINERTSIGGNVSLARSRDDNSPYNSLRFNTFLRFILTNSTLNLSADKITVDNIDSVEDSDLFRYGLILRSRLPNNMIVSTEAYSEKDTGGSIFRSSEHFKLGAQWRIYQLTMNAQAIFSRNQTDTTENEQARIMLTLRRDI